MENYDEKTHVNIGSGEEISIQNLAHLIGEVVYSEAQINFDSSKPDGTPRKLLNVERINSLGWKHRINLKDGIEETYHWYLEQSR